MFYKQVFQFGRYIDGTDQHNPKLDKEMVVAAFAPVSFVCSDKVGEKSYAFSSGEIIYVPYALDFRCRKNYEDNEMYYDLGLMYHEGDINFRMKSYEIEEDANIGLSSVAILGEKICDYIVTNNKEEYYLSAFCDNCPDSNVNYSHYVDFVTKKNDMALVCVREREQGYFDYTYYDKYYKMDLATFECEYIKSFWNEVDKESHVYTKWKDYPEYFGEFMDKSDIPKETTPTEDTPNFNELPYTISVEDDYNCINSEPSFDGDYVEDLPIGTYTIVEEQYDEDDNLWGKLKSGVGWICLSEIYN